MIPRPAPKFRSDKELLEEIRRTQPEIAEAATKKDEHLHKNLQDVRHAYIAFLTPVSPSLISVIFACLFRLYSRSKKMVFTCGVKPAGL